MFSKLKKLLIAIGITIAVGFCFAVIYIAVPLFIAVCFCVFIYKLIELNEQHKAEAKNANT
jgi:uncharacterized membrane protein